MMDVLYTILTISNTTFYDQQVESLLQADFSVVNLTNVSFLRSNSLGNGLSLKSSLLLMDQVRLENNTAMDPSGSFIHVSKDSFAILTNILAKGNRGVLGGIAAVLGQITLMDSALE